MDFVVYSLVNGVVYGLLLFMVSAGLTLIFGMMGILNFAHAAFYMLGAYLAYTLSGLFAFWVGLVVSPILVGIIGALVERYMLRRIQSFGHTHQLLLTFGLTFIIQELIKLFYGDSPVSYDMPQTLNFTAFTLLGLEYPFYRLFMGAVAVVMFVALFLLLAKTRVGMIVRAAERLPSVAQSLGHNVPVIFTGVFAVGSALAGLAGAVAGAFYPTSPSMAIDLGIIVFVVVVVGGLGSVVGSLLASILIGVFTTFAVGLDWSLAKALSVVGWGDWAHHVGGLLTVTLSSVSATVPFVLMLIVLLLRPAGLMGSKN